MVKPIQRFFIFIAVVSFIYLMWSRSVYMTKKTSTNDFETLYQKLQVEFEKRQSNGMKYVLIWTLPNTDPLMYLGQGQDTLLQKKCKVTKCYITTNKTFFDDITQFDVVIFSIKEIVERKVTNLPTNRLPYQRYVFASSESSHYYPLCDDRFNSYFNVTWTYKLNSDIYYGYIIVKNKEGEVIGPRKDMHWMRLEDMDPVNDTLKQTISSKRFAAAWFVSNCNAPSYRDEFVKQLQSELKKFEMHVDIYGSCGTKKCPLHSMSSCLETVERDYYFYLSFENSLSEDYVTEKLLHALQHYAVPIVFGEANYTRFMPDGIYLNARELGPLRLAETMNDIIHNKEKYYDFFKWHNHYSFHHPEEDPKTDLYCNFCEKINELDFTPNSTVLNNVRQWWNSKEVRRKMCPKNSFG